MEPYDVVAKSVDDRYIEFACPFCWTRCTADGRPRANARRVVHSHGSDGDRSLRVEHRVEHCDSSFPRDRCNGFNIHITAATRGARR